MPPWVRIIPSSTVSPPGPTCFHPVRSFPLNSCCHSPDWAFRLTDDNATSMNTQSQCLSIAPLDWKKKKDERSRKQRTKTWRDLNRLLSSWHSIAVRLLCTNLRFISKHSRPSERQMQRHLYETRTADGVLNQAEMPRRRTPESSRTCRSVGP